MERFIDLIKVSKVFSENTVVLDKVDLYINKNEFLTLLGPSGCGKTTTLRIIAGFERPTSGDLQFEGRSILNLPPYKRPVNTIFQKYALFPHLNVRDNVAFGLRIQKMDEKLIKTKVEYMLSLVNLAGYGRRRITALSGGQQQRVAIARALVNEPEVLLLDEPLGALDLKLRKEMQLELKHMQQELGITFVYVTHDQEEALTMSDTIAVMNDGRIQQIGRPEDIYNEPKNAFVADFIGESNIISGFMPRAFVVEFSGASFDCVDKGFGENSPVDVVIRPEDIKLRPAEDCRLKGIVDSVTFKGVHYEMIVSAPDGAKWKVHSTKQAPAGSAVGLRVGPDDIHIMKSGKLGFGETTGGG
ncbi:MAG: ABC transporter ATP-binding protein [Clostridiales bacterium]|jgi:spermidine/putrescine transport system ATP-binding protein|nr:ABC transporter ATP-binding protein [Clostridiales bacterium]